jgi:DNA mismatch repair protein MSH4
LAFTDHIQHIAEYYRHPLKMATSRGQSSSRSTATGTYPSNKQTTTVSRPFTGRSRPRTAATTTGVGENEIICSICESRGISPTIGLSFVNLSTSEAVLCQFTDTQTYARTCHKIKVFSPSEIIHMKTAADSKLFSIIRENLEVDKFEILMTGIDRRYWSDRTGYEYVQQLAFPEDLESLKVTIGGNYFAACCFAAVGDM